MPRQQAAQLLLPPPTLSGGGGMDGGDGGQHPPATAADALGSLDRIVGLWRQACQAKDGQLQQLHAELDQVSVCLCWCIGVHA